MKIICKRSRLLSAVTPTASAVDKTSNLDSIKGILLEANGDNLTVTGYDFELGIKTKLFCNVEKEGRIVVPAQLFINILKMGDGEELIFESGSDFNCKIKCGNTDYNIKGINPADFPDFPNTKDDIKFSMENSEFCQINDYVIYAVSNDEKRPAHTGVLMKCENGTLTAVALDGYRLAICDRRGITDEEFKIIIPARTMNQVRAIADGKDGKMTISASRRYVVFNVGEYVILSRLLEGEFLDYRRAIPEGYITTCVVNTQDMMNVVERASLIITERLRNPVIFKIADGAANVSCKTDIGNVEETVFLDQTGENIEIGFNNKFVLDALKNSKKDQLVFNFAGSLSPCKITPKDGDDFTYLILPVRYNG
jgi:DNA polymerase-3 subunit beta